ncbi:MAG TPA: glycosyltransferase family 2 protein, partial [Thermoanaerobaculia bacterium]|nr:glycosyltransferase family 2 protein [Thermoanaerobaculia bacterium]
MNIVLPSSPDPRVSILIVTAKQPELLARGLESLARCGSAVPFEVIVVLNDAIPEVKAVVREQVSGAVVIDSSVPLGLAGGSNRARSAARGELLVLFHDDAEAEPGWLDALVETIDAHPEAGAVGSRMLNPDGSPQSLGNVLWSDGNAWPLGAGLRSLLPASETACAVDYCGTSSLLVRASTWDAVGGADERFYPAYYVDVDLCLGIWSLGQAVLCTPASRVRHVKSASTESLFRAFLFRRNQKLLLEKWSGMLASFEPPAPGSVEGLQRAVERAQARWRTARENGVSLPDRRPAPFDRAAQERRTLEIALDLQRAWTAELAAEVAVLRPRAEALARVEGSQWWRLYGRLLPLLRILRRLSRPG